MTKYKEYIDKMLEENKVLFDSFKEIHDQYGLNPDKFQAQFNEMGEKVMLVVRHYEDKLCKRSEGSGYASFTGTLAEKFQVELRKVFPMIDNIGIKVSSEDNIFVLKKINLN
ncbi:MAG TPA: hypothetical protein VF185_00265 [Patescibacteria group bacterium]